MFRKVILAAAMLLAPLSSALSPAMASNLTIKDGTAATQYLCAKTLADGSLAECHVQLDSGLNVIDPATKQYQISILNALGLPFQAGGSIGNTSFGISGTLPAFATPPTVNLGTLNGAATSVNQAAANTSLASIATNTTPPGVGSMGAIPAASTTGTALGTLPAGAKGARFYLAASDSVTFTVAASAPTAAPAATFTISGASTGTGPNWDENLANGAMIYITASTGSPKFRWF